MILDVSEARMVKSMDVFIKRLNNIKKGIKVNDNAKDASCEYINTVGIEPWNNWEWTIVDSNAANTTTSFSSSAANTTTSFSRYAQNEINSHLDGTFGTYATTDSTITTAIALTT